MDIVLRIKGWQAFLILAVGSFLANFQWVGNDSFNLVANSTGLIFYFFWYLSVGLELSNYLPRKVELPRTMFTINAFVLLISFAVLIINFNGFFSAGGFIGFLWIMYLFYAYVTFIFFPAKVLRSVELGREATFTEYAKEAGLIFFWLIGIWLIQPRLNRIALEKE